MQIVILDAASLGTDVSLASLQSCGTPFIQHDFTAPEQIIPRLQHADIAIHRDKGVNLGLGALHQGRNNNGALKCDVVGVVGVNNNKQLL